MHQKRNGLQDCDGFGDGLRPGRGAPLPDVGAEPPAPADADGPGTDAEADADALAEALGRALRDGRTDVLGATETGAALAGAAGGLSAAPATWSSTDAVTGCAAPLPSGAASASTPAAPPSASPAAVSSRARRRRGALRRRPGAVAEERGAALAGRTTAGPGCAAPAVVPQPGHERAPLRWRRQGAQ